MLKARICLIIPSLNSGGMERVMSELAKWFCAQPDLDVHLIMFGINPQMFYSVPPNLMIHTPRWKFDNSKRIWHTIRRLLFVRKTIKSIHPTTVLSFGEYWNSFVLLALVGLKYPIFVSDRCQPNKSLGKLHDFLRQRLYPKATGVIAQTSIAREIYQKQIMLKNVEVIGNPIRMIEGECSSISREKIVLSVGRLIQTKHHDILIDIFANINMPDWKLVIVGGDAIKQQGMKRLSDKIKNYALEDRVILTGNSSDVDSYYLKSSIFAFTSSSEGFPNVIGEAMSAGLPIIAFDCIAGPSEMVASGENGYLVPLFDLSQYEINLKKLMIDESLRTVFGRNSRTMIREFSNDRISRKFQNFILPKE